MRQKVSGTRDGADWPEVGDRLDVSDAEGAALITAGVADETPAAAKTGKRAAVKPPPENAAD